MKIFPNLVKEIDIQIQEAQRVPSKMKPQRPTPRYIRINMQNFKDKERILKAATKQKTNQLPEREFPSDCQLICQHNIAGQQTFAKKCPK